MNNKDEFLTSMEEIIQIKKELKRIEKLKLELRKKEIEIVDKCSHRLCVRLKDEKKSGLVRCIKCQWNLMDYYVKNKNKFDYFIIDNSFDQKISEQDRFNEVITMFKNEKEKNKYLSEYDICSDIQNTLLLKYNQIKK